MEPEKFAKLAKRGEALNIPHPATYILDVALQHIDLLRWCLVVVVVASLRW